MHACCTGAAETLGRYRRVIMLCWLPGKGLLLTVGAVIDSHKALRVHLGKEFIRHGKVSSDTAAFVDELYKNRLMADYELKSFSRETAAHTMEEGEAHIEQFENHL